MRRIHVEDVRDHNRSVILALVFRRPRLSRSEIASISGLTEAAVSRITRKLIDSGLIVECAAAMPGSGPGRRTIGLEAAAGGGAVLGICLTLFESCVELVNLRGEVVSRRSLEDQLRLPAEDAVQSIATEARAIIADTPRVLGGCVVVAGAIDHSRCMVTAGSLPSLVGMPLGSFLTEQLGIPIVCENLGNALNLADKDKRVGSEPEGASLLVHVAIGLGMSLVMNGRPHRHEGDERAFGHIPVSGATATCFCGRIGCLNTLAAGSGLLSQCPDWRTGPSSGSTAEMTDAQALSTLVDAALDGDAELGQVFFNAGKVLGRHLATMCIAPSPRSVTVAGPVAQVPAYQQGVRDGLEQVLSHAGAPLPALRISEVSYVAATRSYAIEEFLLNSPIYLEDSTGEMENRPAAPQTVSKTKTKVQPQAAAQSRA